MNEHEYIKVLKLLYDGANEYTIKVWTTEPSYSNLQRTIRLVKSYGYNELFYTCSFEDRCRLRNIAFTNGVTIYDREDVIQKCINIGRNDLLKIIDKGI
jgi:hypothetical protein